MQDIERFLNGFRQFQQKYFVDQPALFDDLRQGQHPATLLIGCCDSRADPALLMGCDPGDIFTIRNVAALVPPLEHGTTNQGVSAAIEFAVCGLNVSRIIVLGHAYCGGIRALMQGGGHLTPQGFLTRWVNIAKPAREHVLKDPHLTSPEARQKAAELASILVSLENLLTFPWVKAKVESGQLSLHGWYFDIEQGALLAYSPRRGTFLPVVCPIDKPPTS
uniref:Carbonic anhydrase n=1 Tax=Chitinivorax tropicus TaxID=714531 RepID=A0A840MUJ4_9PROT|nr:carbonic anhydrase [Chitinivorax tropicus]MBB5020472.1 carbonic anhydrase [Chitinivorax tropicus]